jgi:hypothetical protein
VSLVMAVRCCRSDVLDVLEPSLNPATRVSPVLESLCSRLMSVRVLSVLVRVSRVPARPTLVPALLPTKPRVAVFGSRTPAILSVDLPVVLSEPIVRPIRDGRSSCRDRRLVADRSLVTETDCSFPPIKLPMRELPSARSAERLPFIPRTVDELVFRELEVLFELTAGCFACPGAEEFRVPIILPIRERRLVLDSFVTFERDDRLLESSILEFLRKESLGLLERAAG